MIYYTLHTVHYIHCSLYFQLCRIFLFSQTLAGLYSVSNDHTAFIPDLFASIVLQALYHGSCYRLESVSKEIEQELFILLLAGSFPWQRADLIWLHAVQEVRGRRLSTNHLTAGKSDGRGSESRLDNHACSYPDVRQETQVIISINWNRREHTPSMGKNGRFLLVSSKWCYAYSKDFCHQIQLHCLHFTFQLFGVRRLGVCHSVPALHAAPVRKGLGT